jgi:hypothetical protein
MIMTPHAGGWEIHFDPVRINRNYNHYVADINQMRNQYT